VFFVDVALLRITEMPKKIYRPQPPPVGTFESGVYFLARKPGFAECNGPLPLFSVLATPGTPSLRRPRVKFVVASGEIRVWKNMTTVLASDQNMSGMALKLHPLPCFCTVPSACMKGREEFAIAATIDLQWATAGGFNVQTWGKYQKKNIFLAQKPKNARLLTAACGAVRVLLGGASSVLFLRPRLRELRDWLPRSVGQCHRLRILPTLKK